jgi:hypothetical protein
MLDPELVHSFARHDLRTRTHRSGSLAGSQACSDVSADSFEQVALAFRELLGGGAGRQLVGERAGIRFSGNGRSAGGLERGESDSVGVQGTVRAPPSYAR